MTTTRFERSLPPVWRAWLPARLLARLSARLPARLSVCLPARLPACLSACLLACLGLSTSAAFGAPAAGATAAPPGDTGPAPAAPVPKTVRAPVPDKPSAPIGIEYAFASEPVVGVALDITLTVSAGEAMSQTVVTLDADDPLPVLEPVAPVDLGALAAGESKEVTVTVLPLVEQTHYLRVSVTAVIGGAAQTRAIDVPIRLAGAKASKPQSEAPGKNEEAVRSFRGVETVR